MFTPTSSVESRSLGLEPSCRAYETQPSACPPARESVADLGVEPNIQAYETRSGAGPSAMCFSGDGGIRTHTVHVLSVATPSVGLHHHLRGVETAPCDHDSDTWNPSTLSNHQSQLANLNPPSDPWGNRTPAYRLRTCRPVPLDERAIYHNLNHLQAARTGIEPVSSG